MRTDLEVHTEIKIEGGWHHYGCPDIERNYQLFAKMANIRNHHEPLEEPLDFQTGMPEDATFLTKFCAEDWDALGVIYVLNLTEIKKLVKWYKATYRDQPFGLEGVFGFVRHNGWAGLPQDGVEDARFIFWVT